MGKKSIKYDYGECVICGSRMQAKLIKQDFWIRGELIVVEDIPAGVCPRCGEKIVKADIGKMIATLIESPDRIAKSPRISVPAVKFDIEEAIV
jgi:HTH-type transcriptional regulator / antitoxin MqsA